MEGPAMRTLVSLLNPVYWTTAQEAGEAVNGYTLTEGVFKRETQVEFATGTSPRGFKRKNNNKHLFFGLTSIFDPTSGEILRMTHIARGLDSDGVLLIDVVVNGDILQLPSQADIHIKVHKYFFCYLLRLTIK